MCNVNLLGGMLGFLVCGKYIEVHRRKLSFVYLHRVKLTARIRLYCEYTTYLDVLTTKLLYCLRLGQPDSPNFGVAKNDGWNVFVGQPRGFQLWGPEEPVS